MLEAASIPEQDIFVKAAMPAFNSQQRAALRDFVETTGAKESVAVKVSETSLPHHFHVARSFRNSRNVRKERAPD